MNAFQRAAIDRLRREYIPPHLLTLKDVGKEDPQALPRKKTPLAQAVTALCDRMLELAWAARQTREPNAKRQFIFDILVICSILHQLGYHAHADTGRHLFIQATRLDCLMVPQAHRNDANGLPTSGQINPQPQEEQRG